MVRIFWFQISNIAECQCAWIALLSRVLAAAVLFSFSMALAEGIGLTPKVIAWVEDKYGSSARDKVSEWQELIARHQGKDDMQLLRLVNDFFNQVPFYSDEQIWDKEDYWATPVEMLSIDGADCEDYSIAKYFTLREMGVPVDKLRITYVKAIELNQAHMVLAYYSRPGAEPLVLDNLIDRIVPASRRRDLKPVYSFNGEGLWLAKSRGMGKRVGTSKRISLWEDLTARMANEGKQ
ncbi:FIGfam010717 [hydrothermal vent metagenome]|uniref:FIGfam010717 n=1 Tax=hydrothermal vent metagenome TaxID=652676 RepID=A0A3B1APS1_9ZZZZ